MPSLQHHLLSLYLRILKRKQAKASDPVKLRRKLIDEVATKFRLPHGIQIERFSANGIPAEKLSNKVKTDRCIAYLHGGAYVAGSLQSHRHLVAAIANECDADAIHIDYRLAPEHPFPAALDDALNAYLWIVKNTTYKELILTGDSAGGGLSVALVASLLEDQVNELPHKVVLLAPWVDLTGNSPTIDAIGKRDVILSKEMLASSAKMYAHTHPLDQLFISPIHARLEGFPPTLIQVGTKDLLLNDSRQLRRILQEADVNVQFEEWQGAMHVWQFFTSYLPESKKALRNIASFVKN